MRIRNLHVVKGIRILEIEITPQNIVKSPRQAITTTNLNHSSTTNYKTPFLEILLGSLDYLHNPKKYKAFVSKAKSVIRKNPSKYPILTVKGITSKRLKIPEFKLLCKVQYDIGFSMIRLFMKENLYKSFNGLISWFKNTYGNNYRFVLDHNTNLRDFQRLYLDALEKRHEVVFFLNRLPTKNNIEKFIFIQGRSQDEIIRWVSLLNKKAKFGSLNPLFYNWMGYDITAFTTRRGRQQLPQMILEVIKGLSIVPATQCLNEPCVIVPNNTLSQSINQYGLNKKDSVPCSAFSMVQLNTDLENISRVPNPTPLLQSIALEINNFNQIVIDSQAP